MPCIIPICTSCKHFITNDNGVFKCDAFPNGIPDDYFWCVKNIEEILECNNGIKFEDVDE